jgi:hypothetical protein
VSATFTADPQKIFHISPPETVRASELLELARFANELADEVEANWNEIPPDVQQALMRFAYRERHEDLQQWMLSRVRYIIILVRGKELALNKLWNAANRLRDVVLDAVEHNDPAYQKDLTEAIRDALSDTNGQNMSLDEARERHRQIFDKAFE